mgnify:CR=1 FL=1
MRDSLLVKIRYFWSKNETIVNISNIFFNKILVKFELFVKNQNLNQTVRDVDNSFIFDKNLI